MNPFGEIDPQDLAEIRKMRDRIYALVNLVCDPDDQTALQAAYADLGRFDHRAGYHH